MTWHQVLAAAAMLMMVAGGGFFLLGQFHATKMFMSRTEDWRGRTLPWGFLINSTLTEDGRRHRRKALWYYAVAAPFALGTILIFQILEK